MTAVNAILNQVGQLSQAELKQVSERLLKMLKGEAADDSNDSTVTSCRKCGCEHIQKYGKDKNGKQRYKCRDCGATFIETSGSVMSKTWKDESVWESFIEMLLRGVSLKRCAYHCKISERTAFVWRHKILNAIQHDQDNRLMAGIIEADEMFLPVSYKGNHKNSKRFTMPREPYRRGTDNRTNLVPKACIMCAVERNGQSYAEVIGSGPPTMNMVTYAFGERIVPDSIMLADGALAMKNYFEKREDVELIRLQSCVTGSHRGGPPEIRGAYHIQHVNNFHHRLQQFLRKYNGVSTKYLNHYVGLFAWIENHKKIDAVDMTSEMKSCIAARDTYVTAETLYSRPPVPMVA